MQKVYNPEVKGAGRSYAKLGLKLNNERYHLEFSQSYIYIYAYNVIYIIYITLSLPDCNLNPYENLQQNLGTRTTPGACVNHYTNTCQKSWYPSPHAAWTMHGIINIPVPVVIPRPTCSLNDAWHY